MRVQGPSIVMRALKSVLLSRQSLEAPKKLYL